MTGKLATVFGGSGFIGRHLVRRLAADGWRLRIAVRDPDGAGFLRPMGDVGQIVPVKGDIASDAQVERAVAGAQAVVNLVGILYERGPRSFAAIHAEGAGRVARAAARAGAERLVHLSAIGAAADSPAAYARSKAAGETAVAAAFPRATIVRPSIVFGPEDQFLNRFAAIARVAPVLPVIGPETRFQPVYVGDVAEAIRRALSDPHAPGRTYELGGPGIYTFRALMELMLRIIGRRRPVVALPFGLASLQAAFLERLPVPPLTRDQVRLLQRDNVVAPGAATLADLGVQAQPLEVVAPTYLARFRKAGGLERRQEA